MDSFFNYFGIPPQSAKPRPGRQLSPLPRCPLPPPAAKKMLDYMDIVQNAFHAATNWNPDNSYATLNASTRCIRPPPPSLFPPTED